MLLSLAFWTLLANTEPTVCKEIDEAMMVMSLEEFDQSDNGWRSLDAPGCEAVIADGIERYRDRNPDTLKEHRVLIWHEAQLRASAGQTDEAIELMRLTRESDGPAIRPYTDATIAFLQHDYAALLAARDELIALPEPEYFREAAARFAASYPDQPPLVWPLNLPVVQGLINCFDRPYAEAYECR